MSTSAYPRSPKEQLGGLCHLGRLIDKIRMRHSGLLQEYNYLTTGFDKYLLDYLGIKGDVLEQRVLEGGTDEEILAWVQGHGKSMTEEEKRQWNEMVLNGEPKNDMAQGRFNALLTGIAEKRGVSVDQLPKITKWVEAIDLDEERL
ncbi:DUF5069 domain-containing protein [Candidatus Nitronereus thalassa]|uniref:DUF5069 domain-containing protein n=1 Tax=Candidatus Nitronereus thalassa TaxID=3020898 RepID=A0ABU3K3T0_9BACT|nr:DUF5069 domain-containing protein [Candidatus Nitronereus thalassa]MDT7041043.1 DUF5069 domain-containing protein [Candidatus Nitronereus thalassa]